MWDQPYPFTLTMKSRGKKYVTRYATYGEAIAQKIEWELRPNALKIELHTH